ncbi:MAG TPA: RluA family pseudouridine synthase [Ktedonobacterales bacterium]|nr:RluA family pseudouridine synthase [Ktedonobacterales bacterium]
MSKPARTDNMTSTNLPEPSAMSASFVVTGDLIGQRLDRALALTIDGLSRTRAQAAIEAGRVTVDGHPAKASLILEEGMRIAFTPSSPATETRTSDHASEVEPLDIIYEDDHILVVNKPAGIVVHPAPGHEHGTLVDALRAHLPYLSVGGDPLRPGIVHRLDKDTSGLLIVAKDAPSHAALTEQMKAHSMVKRYLALVEGQVTLSQGIVEAPIGRDPRYRQKMKLVSQRTGGRNARTRFRVLRYVQGRTLLELQLETGRTHQIRVHMAAIHHPIVGDPTYGRSQPPQPPRQFLHATHLEFTHPITGVWLTFDAPLPDDLAQFLRKLES